MTATVLPSFGYTRPRTLAEACARLREPDAVAYAGGTDLLVAEQERGLLSNGGMTLVDIKGLAEARGVELHDGRLRVGAVTTADALARDVRLRAVAPALTEAAALTAAPALRRRATLGGNICTPHPAGDIAAALLALDAEVEIASPAGGERAALAAVFDGRRGLQPGEIVLAVRLPPAQRSAFLKFGPRLGLCRAIVSAAVCLRDGEAHAALGGVAARPRPMPRVAAVLTSGADLDAVIVAECEPPNDELASAAYRLRLAATLLRRCWSALTAESMSRD